MTEPVKKKIGRPRTKKKAGPSPLQIKAAELREKGLGFKAIADELGLPDRRVAQDVLKAHDDMITEGNIDSHFKKHAAKPPVTKAEKAAARIRSKQTIGGKQVKDETESERVIKLMQKARVMALTFLDAEVLQKETGRGLVQIAAVLTDKIQLLKGEPTSISRVEDVRKMDDILEVLQDEMKKRGLDKEKVVN